MLSKLQRETDPAEVSSIPATLPVYKIHRANQYAFGHRQLRHQRHHIILARKTVLYKWNLQKNVSAVQQRTSKYGGERTDTYGRHINQRLPNQMNEDTTKRQGEQSARYDCNGKGAKGTNTPHNSPHCKGSEEDT